MAQIDAPYCTWNICTIVKLKPTQAGSTLHFVIGATFSFIFMFAATTVSARELPCAVQMTAESQFGDHSHLTFVPLTKFDKAENRQVLEQIVNPEKIFRKDQASDYVFWRADWPLQFIFAPGLGRNLVYTEIPNFDLTQDDYPVILPQRFILKLEGLAKELLQKGEHLHNRKVHEIHLNVRVTSNSYGFSVRPDQNADAEGFHTHAETMGDSFALSLIGLGTRYPSEAGIHHTEVGELILFGRHFKHGSPDSEEARLLVFGTIYYE